MDTHDDSNLTYQQRLDALRAAKLLQTREKQKVIGSMDHDDHGLILPPADRRKIVQTMSSSGMPITDCLLEGFEIESNHPSGGFFGPRAWGKISAGCCACTRFTSIQSVRWRAGTWSISCPTANRAGTPISILSHLDAPTSRTISCCPGSARPSIFARTCRSAWTWAGAACWRKSNATAAKNAPQRKQIFTPGWKRSSLAMQDWIQRGMPPRRARWPQAKQNPQLRQNLLEIAEMNE